MKNILLTNDDGFFSDGIRQLYTELSHQYQVTIVAPEKEQSGIGHAFTFNNPLSYREIPQDKNVRGFAVNGTPADCVKFALSHILPAKPHMVISGINNGENSGISGFYSGTVAGAREGAIWRIPSVAFSMCVDTSSWLKDYAGMCVSILDVLNSSFSKKISDTFDVFFNVNFPAVSLSKCKGLKMTRQSCAFFNDRYREEKTESEETLYRLYGSRMEMENTIEYDTCALEEGYITITPLTFDATAYDALKKVSEEDFKGII